MPAASSIPLAQIEEEYEKLHPDIDLRFEGHGSIQVIRHTTEIGDPASVGDGRGLFPAAPADVPGAPAGW